MVKHLWVLDDSSPKIRPLARAVTRPQERGGLGGVAFDEFFESRVDLESASSFRAMDPYARQTVLQRHDLAGFRYTFHEIDSVRDLVHMPLRTLAHADAFFVDFKLESLRFGDAGHEIDVDGRTHEIRLSTGVGALLYLHDVLDSDEYWEARAAARPYEKVDRSNPSHRPQLFTYVNLREASAKFFATAAAWWLGVRCFPLQEDYVAGAKQLVHVLGGGRLPSDGGEEERVRVLHSLLTGLDTSRAEYFGDDDRGRDVRRWLDAYRAGGRTRAAFSNVIDESRMSNVTNQITAQLHPLYGSTRRFAALWTQSADEPWASDIVKDESTNRHFQQMLMDSSEFWEAQDVGAVFRLWRLGALRRIGPVPLPAVLEGPQEVR